MEAPGKLTGFTELTGIRKYINQRYQAYPVNPGESCPLQTPSALTQRPQQAYRVQTLFSLRGCRETIVGTKRKLKFVLYTPGRKRECFPMTSGLRFTIYVLLEVPRKLRADPFSNRDRDAIPDHSVGIRVAPAKVNVSSWLSVGQQSPP